MNLGSHAPVTAAPRHIIIDGAAATGDPDPVPLLLSPLGMIEEMAKGSWFQDPGRELVIFHVKRGAHRSAIWDYFNCLSEVATGAQGNRIAARVLDQLEPTITASGVIGSAGGLPNSWPKLRALNRRWGQFQPIPVPPVRREFELLARFGAATTPEERSAPIRSLDACDDELIALSPERAPLRAPGIFWLSKSRHAVQDAARSVFEALVKACKNCPGTPEHGLHAQPFMGAHRKPGLGGGVAVNHGEDEFRFDMLLYMLQEWAEARIRTPRQPTIRWMVGGDAEAQANKSRSKKEQPRFAPLSVMGLCEPTAEIRAMAAGRLELKVARDLNYRSTGNLRPSQSGSGPSNCRGRSIKYPARCRPPEVVDLDPRPEPGTTPEVAGTFEDESVSEPHTPEAILAYQEWKSRYEAVYERFIPESFAHSGSSPVKIAILDSGIDLTHPDMLARLENIKGTYNPLNPLNKSPDSSVPDCDGHGTFMAGLLLDYAPDAELYVARVAENKELDARTIAKAIDHAVSVWRVEVISMSFGFPTCAVEGYAELESALLNAYANRVLLFAAASNNGGRLGRCFPAREPTVIAVHATDAYGNRSRFSPTAAVDEFNLATIGEAVESAWPAHLCDKAANPTWVRYKSGTSSAAPIAAGIAAFLLMYARVHLPDKADALRSHRRMKAVLKRVAEKGAGYQPRDGYYFLDISLYADSLFGKEKQLIDLTIGDLLSS